MLKKEIETPVAEKIPKELKIHDDVRIDNYYWLNDKENPKVIDYLNAENKYYDEVTEHTKQFQEDLFQEMNTDSFFYVKKSTRKILRLTKKYIRFSKQKQTEVDLLLHLMEFLLWHQLDELLLLQSL